MNEGKLYTSYKTFIETYKPEYIDLYKVLTYPSEHHRFYLIGKFPHHINDRCMICLIQDIQTKQVFIIGEEGIERGY